MKRQTSYEKDKVFFHIVTLIICLGIILVTSLVLLISFLKESSIQGELSDDYYLNLQYNDNYFSKKILNGVTISGVDVGGMTVDEAKSHLSGAVNYNIKTQKLVLKSGD